MRFHLVFIVITSISKTAHLVTFTFVKFCYFILMLFTFNSYQMTMATIFKTASFKLWQKLTKALPLGPILPNIIPG